MSHNLSVFRVINERSQTVGRGETQRTQNVNAAHLGGSRFTSSAVLPIMGAILLIECTLACAERCANVKSTNDFNTLWYKIVNTLFGCNFNGKEVNITLVRGELRGSELNQLKAHHPRLPQTSQYKVLLYLPPFVRVKRHNDNTCWEFTFVTWRNCAISQSQ